MCNDKSFKANSQRVIKLFTGNMIKFTYSTILITIPVATAITGGYAIYKGVETYSDIATFAKVVGKGFNDGGYKALGDVAEKSIKSVGKDLGKEMTKATFLDYFKPAIKGALIGDAIANVILSAVSTGVFMYDYEKSLKIWKSTLQVQKSDLEKKLEKAKSKK